MEKLTKNWTICWKCEWDAFGLVASGLSAPDRTGIVWDEAPSTQPALTCPHFHLQQPPANNSDKIFMKSKYQMWQRRCIEQRSSLPSEKIGHLQKAWWHRAKGLLRFDFCDFMNNLCKKIEFNNMEQRIRAAKWFCSGRRKPGTICIEDRHLKKQFFLTTAYSSVLSW